MIAAPLTDQIEAVEWAATFALELARRAMDVVSADNRSYRRFLALEAAAENLKTLEFGRAVLK